MRGQLGDFPLETLSPVRDKSGFIRSYRPRRSFRIQLIVTDDGGLRRRKVEISRDCNNIFKIKEAYHNLGSQNSDAVC
jgi:hypothetical protein